MKSRIEKELKNLKENVSPVTKTKQNKKLYTRMKI